MATPLFIVTDAGLAVASVATPVGPYIHITKFAVGSGVDYQVTPDQTSLNGDLLYEDGISSYQFVGNNTINIVCKIPADAGPFKFGEIALYLDDGTMFAKAAFDEYQEKFSSLGTNLALVYTFNCLIKLQQSVAVFQITANGTGGDSALVSVERWTDVTPPALSANPDLPMIAVKELDSLGQAALLVSSSDDKWTIASAYFNLGQYPVLNATTGFIECAVADWPFVNSGGSPYDVEHSDLVLETPDGWFRKVTEVQHIGAPVTSVRFILAPEPLTSIPQQGELFLIHTNDQVIGEAYERWSADTGIAASILALQSDNAAIHAILNDIPAQLAAMQQQINNNYNQLVAAVLVPTPGQGGTRTYGSGNIQYDGGYEVYQVPNSNLFQVRYYAGYTNCNCNCNCNCACTCVF